jgi:uncharacterized coiled-coil DUF342 family protein
LNDEYAKNERMLRERLVYNVNELRGKRSPRSATRRETREKVEEKRERRPRRNGMEPRKTMVIWGA